MVISLEKNMEITWQEGKKEGNCLLEGRDLGVGVIGCVLYLVNLVKMNLTAVKQS